MITQALFDGIYPVTFQNLAFYRVHAFDQYPHLKHAIFTRKGGVSRPPFQALNLSTSVGDSLQAVKENTQIACQAINVSLEQMVSCYLVHGADILTINTANRQQVMGHADGLITRDLDVYLFMRFGDCTPLIFFDPVQHAIGLTHAGWRGTMQNAAGATVSAMVDEFRCQPIDIVAVVGPSIGPCCYEVGQDVMAAAAETFVDSSSLFIRHNGNPNHAHFDMWEANQRQLVEAGIERIIQTRLCTACRTDEFFSHRAENGSTGRFGVIIGLQAEGRVK